MSESQSCPAVRLIVNADDFGQSSGINRGVAESHERGVVTSASLLVLGAAARDAAGYAKSHPTLSVGLHADLGEWSYIDNEWVALYRVLDQEDEDSVERELARQLDVFRGLLRRDPTHLDSHQHAHRDQTKWRAFAKCAAALSIPLRHDGRVRYVGQFYGQTNKGDPYPEWITARAFAALVRGLTAGVTEIGCHPADAADVDSMYGSERVAELRVLCDPTVRAAVQAAGVELTNFAAVGRGNRSVGSFDGD